MRIVYGSRFGASEMKVWSGSTARLLFGPLDRVCCWYRHRFCLRNRLPFMTVLRQGSVCACAHAQLRSGFLDLAGFWPGYGDDIRCIECGQVWAATTDSDRYRLSGDQAGTVHPVYHA